MQLNWSECIQDIDLIENVFHVISRIIYYQLQFSSRDNWWIVIPKIVGQINSGIRNQINMLTITMDV